LFWQVDHQVCFDHRSSGDDVSMHLCHEARFVIELAMRVPGVCRHDGVTIGSVINQSTALRLLIKELAASNVWQEMVGAMSDQWLGWPESRIGFPYHATTRKCGHRGCGSA
jgi:hypothetical protein